MEGDSTMWNRNVEIREGLFQTLVASSRVEKTKTSDGGREERNLEGSPRSFNGRCSIITKPNKETKLCAIRASSKEMKCGEGCNPSGLSKLHNLEQLDDWRSFQHCKRQNIGLWPRPALNTCLPRVPPAGRHLDQLPTLSEMQRTSEGQKLQICELAGEQRDCLK